jgi:hypothetical protein
MGVKLGLTLRELYALKMRGSEVLRRIFGRKIDEITQKVRTYLILIINSDYFPKHP